MVTREEHSFTLYPASTERVTIDAACINANLPIPGDQDRFYGVPTVLQGDSFAYLPDETGELDSYGALFDPRFKGFVALEDNYTTAGQKTALYLNASGQAQIADPSDMTPEHLSTTKSTWPWHSGTVVTSQTLVNWSFSTLATT